MAIAKNPKRNQQHASEKQAEAFIPSADKVAATARASKKKPTMIRIDPEMLSRIDRAARRLGISRSAFIVSSTAERLERME